MNSELIFEGKKYISSKRGAEITLYSQDYIGQLCRKGKLDCRVVGRHWFVTESSLLVHKSTAEKSYPHVPQTVAEVSVQKTQNLTPIIVSDESSKNVPVKNFKKGLLGAYLVLTFLFAMSYLAYSASDFSLDNFSLSSSNSALTVIGSYTDAKQSLANSMLVLGTSNAIPFSDSNSKIKTFAFNFINFTKNIYADALALLDSKFGNKNLTVNNYDYSEPKVGLVVVPGTGEKTKDEKLKDTIKNSFSDEVQVYPDGSETSGAIRPVFKNSKDNDYLYVVVPIKN